MINYKQFICSGHDIFITGTLNFILTVTINLPI